ncbi:hypothetical protein BGX27_002353 [Mortierella sp. AM989]|nr:hypothetical protein BGX27_002353 [Mortierella sp. AM989]
MKRRANQEQHAAASSHGFLLIQTPKFSISTNINSLSYSPAASLCCLMNLPIEIIDAILCRLKPRDLIHLTQVNKVLRHIARWRLDTIFDIALPVTETLLQSHTTGMSATKCSQLKRRVEFEQYVKLILQEYNQFQSRHCAAFSGNCMVASAMVTASKLLTRLWRPDYSLQGCPIGFLRYEEVQKHHHQQAQNTEMRTRHFSSSSSGNDMILCRAEFIVYWIARKVLVTAEWSPVTAILLLEYLDELYLPWSAIHASYFSSLTSLDMQGAAWTDLVSSDSFLFSNFFFRVFEQATKALLSKPYRLSLETYPSLFASLDLPLPISESLDSSSHLIQCLMVWSLRCSQVELFDPCQITRFLPKDYCKLSNPEPEGFDSSRFNVLLSGFVNATLAINFFAHRDRPFGQVIEPQVNLEEFPELCASTATSIKELLEMPEANEIKTYLGCYWDLRLESDLVLHAILSPKPKDMQLFSLIGMFTSGITSVKKKDTHLSRPSKRIRRQ